MIRVRVSDRARVSKSLGSDNGRGKFMVIVRVRVAVRH